MARSPILNVPNILSFVRVLLVPAFVAALIFMRDIEIWGIVVPAILYGLTALTDMLDGKIARKYGLVTDFGKFIDPLADKFMVLGSMLAILVWVFLRGETLFGMILVWLVLIILFRELGVTSLRLVVAGKKKKVDLAANMMGKLKTVSQMVGTVVIIAEPLITPYFDTHRIASYVCMAIMAFTTIVSGWNYFVGYLPHIVATDEPEKPVSTEPATEPTNTEA
ncbi:MAG: CDP-diacylglycerol--glycerol-3-phosphate 3-phosphatidyltransferase [Clostridia bacterium]|nr:CDP-diacylglycerol--glycerol-3-phosphate 3-phosphatidyltransferase [Clostridia bacterium]